MRINEVTPKSAALQEVGERLARVRKHRGFTQAQLAREAGIGVATLQRIEDGRDAQLGSWFKLLKALEMTPAFDGLLPESLESPMLEVKSGRRRGARRVDKESTIRWGDERE